MKSEREKMVAGELYLGFDPELVEVRILAREKMAELSATPPRDLEKRREIIRSLFGSTGPDIHVEPPFACDYGFNIHVGNNFYANFDLVILDVAEVRIGENCFIAPQVGIYTATHPVDPTTRNSGLEYGKPITIGNSCWIGGRAVINPGVTLGDNVVVGAGAVVTKSFGDNVILVGNPARVLRKIEDV